MPALVAIGTVAGAHGLGGELRLRGFADDPGSLSGVSAITLASSADAADAVRYAVTRIAGGRPGELRVALRGIDSRDAAVAAKGLLALADPAELEPLSDGEYYGYQLVGCKVFGEDGRSVGVVRDILATGAADVLIVADEAGTEHLIPAAEAFLHEVDVAGRRIVVDLIPGLLEAQGA